MKRYMRFLCIAVALIFLLTGIPVLADNSNIGKSDSVIQKQSESIYTDLSYRNYLKNFGSLDGGKELTLSANQIISYKNAEFSNNINNTDIDGVIINDDGNVTWQVTVPKKSAYVMVVNYMPAQITSGDIELALKIDDKIPFKEISSVEFKRIYTQDISDFKINTSGNDIKPLVSQKLIWQENIISDPSGYIAEPFLFCFSEGFHTIRFEGSRGKIVINKITLKTYNQPINYEDYQKSNQKKYTLSKSDDIIIEGEKFTSKNSITVLPNTDRTSPLTYPQSAKGLKLNTIGGSNWRKIGDSVTWSIDVKHGGMYEIALRYRQNIKDGIFTNRKLLIDGKIPFKEAEAIRFYYSSIWSCEKLGNSNGSYAFFLKKGQHTITLEAVAGDSADIISTVEKSISKLNNIYRKILMITGSSPDIKRDYGFESLIPDEIKEMSEIKDELKKSVDYINEQAGINGSYVSIIQKIIFQLEEMSGKPRNIAKYLQNFKSNLGALSEWLLTAVEQPLEIDRIYINPVGTKLPKANSGFFRRVQFSLQCFIFSYITDYNSIGQTSTKNNESKKLKVWIQTGRDQGEIIRDLIDTTFSEKFDTQVTLQIVVGTLLESVLAGIAPDVVLDNAETQPVDYSLRNAVVDLKQFNDFNKVASWFSEASLKPACFDGSVYGLPQTFDFMMFFYRTDIFEQFGYSVPKTWNELIDMIPSMQRRGLEIGIPHNINMYTTILYQNDGELYREKGRYNNLNDSKSINAFIDYTDFFTLYNCPVSYNFANRFRSGEMACAVANYSQYNQLTAFAPEIKGLWKMVPIPGTYNTDGSFCNDSVGIATYMMMMKTCSDKQLAWNFMKWYMSEDTQSSYAIQMESVLGTCAKVTTANVKALSKMTWSSSEYNSLFSQLKNVNSIPQVPGGYYMSRILEFAYNRVYNNAEDPEEVLSDYVKDLNDEISRKREELGLE